MSISLKSSVVTTIYVFDEDTGMYTFCLLEKGGPVIVSNDLETGKRNFEEAFKFSTAVRNLQYFDDISVFRYINSENSRVKNKVEYQELKLA